MAIVTVLFASIAYFLYNPIGKQDEYLRSYRHQMRLLKILLLSLSFSISLSLSFTFSHSPSLFFSLLLSLFLQLSWLKIFYPSMSISFSLALCLYAIHETRRTNQCVQKLDQPISLYLFNSLHSPFLSLYISLCRSVNTT